MMTTRFLKALPLLAAVAACTSTVGPDFLPPIPVSPAEPALAKIWHSDGYGYLIDARAAPPRVYELTPNTCVEIETGADSLLDFYDTVSVGRSGQLARFANDGILHKTQYRVVPVIPDRCLNPPSSAAPLVVFEHFAAYFDHHYVFFDVFGVDWASRVEATRPQITPDMSDTALFETLASMLDGINDAHVELIASIDGERRTYDAGNGRLPHYIAVNAEMTELEGTSPAAAFLDAYWKENIPNLVLGGNGASSDNSAMQWGMVDEDVGYIAAINVARYAAGDPYPEENRAAARQAIKTAIGDLEANGAQSIILDLSVNFGGFDYVAQEIARHLIAEPVDAYSKQARDTDNLIPPTRYRLEPAETAFAGDVYVLTSNVTVSGGEILTMALRAAPNVIHAGEITRGSLSDKLNKSLPNGWEVNLSNEVYLDHEGQAWEGKGVPPDLPMTVFESDDPLSSHMAAISFLVEHMKTSE